MITAKINCVKIQKEHLFVGKNGAKYLDLVFFENRDGPDQYGNDGFIVQGLNKEARDRGEKGPILGNWKRGNERSRQRSPAPQRPVQQALPKPDPLNSTPPPDDDVPF